VLSLFSLPWAGAGCGFHEEPPVPLYPGERLGAGQVATLGGYVAHVDGRDVGTLGGAFELLPGCHVVATPTHWGGGNSYGGVAATTGVVTFAVPMVAGNHYLVITESGGGNSAPTAQVTVRVDESNPGGDFVRSFERVKSSAEVEACRQPPGP
jgi:hypothetical protein